MENEYKKLYKLLRLLKKYKKYPEQLTREETALVERYLDFKDKKENAK